MVGPSIRHSPICTIMKSKWKVSMREGWAKLLTYNIKLFLLKGLCMNAHSVLYVWISINTNTQRMHLVMCYLFQKTRHDNLVRHTVDAGQKISNKRSRSNAKTSNEQTYALKFIDINLVPNEIGSEWASKRANERTSEASNAEQTNEWAVRVNRPVHYTSVSYVFYPFCYGPTYKRILFSF